MGGTHFNKAHLAMFYDKKHVPDLSKYHIVGGANLFTALVVKVGFVEEFMMRK